MAGTGNEGALQLEGKQLRGFKTADATVIEVTGKALAHSGGVPLVIVNKFKSGQAIVLNLEVADYAYLRLKGNYLSSLPDLMESVFALADVMPEFRVLGADGKSLPGTEIVRFSRMEGASRSACSAIHRRMTADLARIRNFWRTATFQTKRNAQAIYMDFTQQLNLAEGASEEDAAHVEGENAQDQTFLKTARENERQYGRHHRIR